MHFLSWTGPRRAVEASTPPRLGWTPAVWDLVLAALCVAVAVTVQVASLDSIPVNRPPDVWSVVLTVSAVAPLVLRRRYPLPVLMACVPGLLALVAGRYAVGAAPLGVLIAFYTVTAWGTSRDAARGLGVLAVGVAGVLALRPVDLSIEGALSNTAVLVVGWVLGTGARERRALHAAQVAEAERRIELEHERGSRAAAEERLRITRELHDVLGHAMSVMVVQAGVAEHLLDTQPEQARDALARISQTGRSSLQEMRQLLATSRDDADGSPRRPQPRLSDLPALVAQVEASGLPVQLTTSPPGVLSQGTPPGVELAAYRIVQEALTNTLKHAGPAQARVRMTRPPGAVEIEVIDNGRGPRTAASGPDVPVVDGPGSRPPGSEGPEAGQGLIGMRERVAVYAGELVTGAAPGGGFRVWARFPLPGTAANGGDDPRPEPA